VCRHARAPHLGEEGDACRARRALEQLVHVCVLAPAEREHGGTDRPLLVGGVPSPAVRGVEEDAGPGRGGPVRDELYGERATVDVRAECADAHASAAPEKEGPHTAGWPDRGGLVIVLGRGAIVGTHPHPPVGRAQQDLLLRLHHILLPTQTQPGARPHTNTVSNPS
jgi:hypothetical protein